ncbi:MAG: hypothetical protein GEU99_25845 [Luteitalea sp.]|nr:hypothetical protein [Luteitalea sp.]
MDPGPRPLRSICLLTTALAVASGAAPQRGPDLRTVAEEVFEATVTRVEDGDSIVINSAPEPLTLHLDGVDAPEISQEFGPESKAFLAKLVVGKVATIRLKSRSSAGEEDLARIILKGSDLSLVLIENGMAWYCRGYSRDDELERAEKAARAAKRGLWRASPPEPPWQHRGAATCGQE